MKKIIELVIYEDDTGYSMKFKYRDFKLQGQKQMKNIPFKYAQQVMKMAEESMPADLAEENKVQEKQ